MAKKWIAVNLGLLVVAGVLAWQLQLQINRFKTENDLGTIAVPRLPGTTHADSTPPPRQSPYRYNAGEFGVIAGQNLFSELRGKPEEDPTKQAPESPPLQVRPVLVGVSIVGNHRLASMIDPTAPPGPGGVRRTQTKRVGDVYQGYTVVDIAETQMVLENGRRREIIPLFDSTKQRGAPGKTPIMASRVVAFGAGAAGGAPAATGVVRPGQVPPRPGTPGAQAASQPAAPPPGASVNQQPSVRTAVPPPQTRAVPGNAPQQPTTWNERTDEQGRRIIRTPFGDIVRDKPNN